jgi:hypothetical protein
MLRHFHFRLLIWGPEFSNLAGIRGKLILGELLVFSTSIDVESRPGAWARLQTIVAHFRGQGLVYFSALEASAGGLLSGLPTDFDRELVKRIRVFGDAYAERTRGPGIFDAAVEAPTDANPMDRFTAFIGLT